MTLRRGVFGAAAAVLLSLTAVAATASAPAPVTAQLQRSLDEFLRAHPSFTGIALAVTTPRLEWTGAAGVTARSSRTPLAPEAPFRIASVTKTFTAAAILRLVEEGRLSLDDPIAEHLSPSTVALLRRGGYDVPSIRVRHLLQHTSGLYDYAEDRAFQAYVVGHPRHNWTRAEQVRFAMTHGKPLFRPGTEQAYSDTGYVLLGEMLERLTGGSLAGAYRQLLRLDRLGLDHTYLEKREAGPTRTPPRLHQYLETVDTTGIDPSFDLYGGGGLVSTVGDLARFYRGLFAGRVFEKRSTLATMLQRPRARNAGDSMGLFARPIGGEMCWGHNGFWGIDAYHCPRSGITIATTANQALADVHRLHDVVYRLVKRA